MKNITYLCNENPSGEVSLPLAQNFNLMTSLRSMIRVKNQTLIEIRCFIRLSGFHFSYSFQGFRIPLLSSLLTLQRYKENLKNTNFSRCIFQLLSKKIAKSFARCNIIAIFAASKFHLAARTLLDNLQPFLCHYIEGKQNYCTVSGVGKPPRRFLLSETLTARSAVSLCQKNLAYEIRNIAGQHMPTERRRFRQAAEMAESLRSVQEGSLAAYIYLDICTERRGDGPPLAQCHVARLLRSLRREVHPQGSVNRSSRSSRTYRGMLPGRAL